MKFQKAGVFRSPRSSYEEAGIELVRTNEYTLHDTWAQVFKDLDISEIEPYDFQIKKVAATPGVVGSPECKS